MFWRIHVLQKLVVGHLTLGFKVSRSLWTFRIKKIIAISICTISFSASIPITAIAISDLHTLHGHGVCGVGLQGLGGFGRLGLGRHGGGGGGVIGAFQDLVGRTFEVGRQGHITDDAEQGVPVLKVSYSVIASDSQPPLRVIRKTSCFDSGHLHFLLFHGTLKDFDHLIRLELPHCVVARHLQLLRHYCVLHNLTVGPHHLTEDVL
mmetsp:Transcript_17225/g.29321  ORF Transcript_17225/g.29321 Transcript_17225/m.29321 type:complete len:206 (-) Transcript_17225:182-799(-)